VVTKALASNGTVEILADGSIKYTPRPGFAGTDRITYVISDGNGGTAIASVVVTVADDGYTEKPPIFGFNGPEQPKDGQTDKSASPPAPVTADGAVVDAVFDIGELRSVAAQLSADGVVLSATNGVRSLDGIGSVGFNGAVVEAIRAERAREILLNAGFDRGFQEYRIDGLPGFSMRNNVPGNLGGLSSREQVIIESLVRQDTLIIQISNTLESGNKRIVEYRVTRSDGSALPSWLDRAGNDMLIGRRDANSEMLQLKVEAVYSDGSVIVEEVKIDTATGEIQQVTETRQRAQAPRMFGDQFNAPSMLSSDQIQRLGRAIAR
ncbi:MAG: Ig-like domain-containing protein, partial [Hyphomicrobium sp.]